MSQSILFHVVSGVAFCWNVGAIIYLLSKDDNDDNII
jgi:hypothetical protein